MWVWLEWSPVRGVGENGGGVSSSMFQAEGFISSAKECPVRPHSLPFSSPSLDPDLDQCRNTFLQHKGQKDRLTQPSRNEALLWGQHEAMLLPEAVSEGVGCSLGSGMTMATASSNGTQQTASMLLCWLPNTPARSP